MFYKRGKTAKFFIYILTVIISILCVGCDQDELPPIKQIGVHNDFSVNYIDVGQGDCIFIRLPDGKNLLIDCGINDVYAENRNRIMDILNAYSVNTIDYFILTHPDLDHIGNAKDIINKFNIKTMYLPHVADSLMSNFEHYQSVLELIESKQIQSVTSDYSCAIQTENYVFAFLSPVPKGIDGSSYSVLENTLFPTDRQINDLSPIIYFECFGKKFVFTGDASSTQEKIVINNYSVGLYDLILKNNGINIDLKNVDYLKVSHHGSDDATCREFISLLQPKNFIISVGKENFYGHPKTEVLELILTMCPESKVYRTDQVGTISVHKDKQNKIVVSTAK